jgi:pimeloyl-ACP methyl ester carboxylesterase
MKTQKLEYITKDGVKIAAIINKPEYNPISCIIFCHGITADKDGESGKFLLMAEKLCKEGFEVLRFDFRGHGESGMKSENMTIMGELLDLEASALHIAKRFKKVGILAASFGAEAAILFAIKNPNFLKTLALWNPVLDYEQTFLNSQLPWGKSIFGSSWILSLKENGYLEIPGKDFRLGKDLIREFSVIKPFEDIMKLDCPVLTFHGTNDTKVPFWISEKFGKPNDKSMFIPIESDHGFGNLIDCVYEKTINWIKNIFIEN